MPPMPEHDPGADQPPVRPEVVQAVFSALTDLDPGKIEDLLATGTGVTPAEYQQAKDLYLASAIAGLDQQERKLKVFQVLTANRQLTEGTGWDDLYDSLTADQVAELRELYDAMPDGARAEDAGHEQEGNEQARSGSGADGWPRPTASTPACGPWR
jgi:hypothetical protein